ncbi:MAG TPA: type II toxin-antitoxin system RelE/ParE family toxin [Methanosarcinaceae archaeon]|nr:type II toxin-antitoxin system RelE/ParE family toxin [Methanosarcinaceae archaeon]
MKYSIYFKKGTKKFLDRLDKIQKKRIKERLLILSDNPFPENVKTVVGMENVLRLRIGDFRLLYILDRNEKEIYVVKIDKRSRVYRK